MSNSLLTVKRIIASLIILMLIFALYSIINRGSLTVIMPESGTITIENESGVVTNKEGVKKIHSFLRPGTYKISGKHNGKHTVSIIKVNMLSKITSNIDLQSPKKSYRLANLTMTNIYPLDNNTFIGIDTANEVVKYFDNLNSYDIEYKDIDYPPLGLTNLKKLSNNTFIAYGNNSMPIIIDTSTGTPSARTLEKINHQDENDILVSVTPNQDSFWITVENIAYKYNSPYIKPVEKVTIDSKVPYDSFTASTNQLLFFSSTEAVSHNDDVVGNGDNYPFILNTKSGNIYNLKFNILSAAWSPDEKNISIVSSENQYLSIYDTSERKIIKSINHIDSPKVEWSDLDTLLYVISDNIWVYSLKNNTSKLFTNLNSLGTSVTFSDSGIFSSTYGSLGEAGLWWIPSNNPDNYLVKLNEKLPITETDYRIDYSAIGSPLIKVHLTVPLNGATPGRIAQYNSQVIQAKEQAIQKINSLGLQDIPVEFYSSQNL